MTEREELKPLPTKCKHCGSEIKTRVRFDECFDCTFQTKRTEQEG